MKTKLSTLIILAIILTLIAFSLIIYFSIKNTERTTGKIESANASINSANKSQDNPDYIQEQNSLEQGLNIPRG